MARNTKKNLTTAETTENIITETPANETPETVTETPETVETTATPETVETFLFTHEDGTIETVKEEQLSVMMKAKTESEFKAFAEETSFHDVCKTPEWQAPYIGQHEDGTLHFFHKKATVNFKRFITVKFGKEGLKELETEYKDSLKTCNDFLYGIAVKETVVSVNSVKDEMNRLNNEKLSIVLTANDLNDVPYVITANNRMVRVMLVDKAKANKAVEGFKRIGIADFIDVIMTGLSKKYHNENPET